MYTLLYLNWELSLVLCDDLSGWQGEGMYVYLWLIHVVLWQEPTQHCNANKMANQHGATV